MTFCREAIRTVGMRRAGVDSPDPSGAAATPFPPLSPWLPAPGESRSLLDLLESTSETPQIESILSAIKNLFLRSRMNSSDESENSVVTATMSTLIGINYNRIR